MTREAETVERDEHSHQPRAKHDSAAVVDAWFSETFPGSPIARDVLLWNYVFEAVQDLKKRLAGAR